MITGKAVFEKGRSFSFVPDDERCAFRFIKEKLIFPLKDHSKAEKYFINKGLDIYKRLQPYLRNGIVNARKRGGFDPGNPKQEKAEMYKLFEILGQEYFPQLIM